MDIATPDGRTNEPRTTDVVLFTGADAAATREAATAARAELTRRSVELKRAQEEARAELERRRAELEADFARQRAELEAIAGPLREQLARLTEVMWSVDLYLGRDETLQLIRDGKPAPADTPITLRQRVLVMAEESLVLMGRKTTGMNADNIPEFIDWLTEDPLHLDQVLPEAKGVVVLIPTKVKSRSGNMFEDAYRDAVNQESYWLLRNGERLYLLTVDPKLKIQERVLPKRTEFSEVFDRRLFGFGRVHGDPITPGSDEWLEMEKVADARRRHYMRVLMVLQGIIDRTPVWHPLPDGGASFLRLADQDTGKIVLVQDGDDALQLTDGRESFRQYQRRLNALLRPGMRVIGNWNTSGFNDLYLEGDRWTRGTHPRLYPGTLYERPAADEPHLIEDRRDGGLVIRFKRREKIEKRNVPVPGRPGYVYPFADVEPTQRASCLIMPDDNWVLPYDLCMVADLEYFLTSRDNRSQFFLSMVPTIQAALAAKKAEAETEAPFRDLIGRLLVMEGCPAADAPAAVDDLVHWWKVANLWARPLNGEPQHEKKAATEIVAEYRARAVHAADDTADRMVAAGRAMEGVIAVARDRQGSWKAYAPSTPAHDAGVFLDVTTIRRDGSLGAVQREKVLSRRSATSMHVAWDTEQWRDWKFGANRSHYLTAEERAQLTAELIALAPGAPICVTEFFDPSNPVERSLGVYSWTTGTPADRPVVASGDPYTRHYNGDSNPIALVNGRVVKDSGGVRLVDGDRRLSSSFSGYSSRDGSIPWWPDDAHQYGDARPRLIWADADMLAAVFDYRARCSAAADEERARRIEIEQRAYRYSTPVEALIRERMVEQAHERFVEDYGPDAEDLWPAHLDTLKLPAPLHARTLWGLVAIALKHGHPVAGQTLGQLAEFAWANGNQAPGEWHHHGRVDVGDWADLVVPEPADDDRETP